MRRKQVDGRNMLSQTIGDASECAYVFDEASVTEHLGSDDSASDVWPWNALRSLSSFRIHPLGSRAESRGGRVRGQFPRVYNKVETLGAHHGTRVFLGKSKISGHPVKTRAPTVSHVCDGLHGKLLK